jgi:hypothetical protein
VPRSGTKILTFDLPPLDWLRECQGRLVGGSIEAGEAGVLVDDASWPKQTRLNAQILGAIPSLCLLQLSQRPLELL